MPKRITSPLFSGMMPTLLSMMAFSMGWNMLLSQGLMAMVRESGGGDGGHVVDGHHRTIGVHQHLVENVHVGFTGTDVRKGFFEVHHAHFHALFAGGEQLLYV